jgi:hypothetical protein
MKRFCFLWIFIKTLPVFFVLPQQHPFCNFFRHSFSPAALTAHCFFIFKRMNLSGKIKKQRAVSAPQDKSPAKKNYPKLILHNEILWEQRIKKAIAQKPNCPISSLCKTAPRSTAPRPAPALIPALTPDPAASKPLKQDKPPARAQQGQDEFLDIFL